MTGDGVRMTPQTARVLRVMLDAPGEPHYGLTLLRATGLASGSLYPILRRLDAAGWTTSAWEVLEPVEQGRPPRRYYRLTVSGTERARHALAELHEASETRRPSGRGSAAPVGLRPARGVSR